MLLLKDREISVGQIRSLTPTNTGVQMMLQDEKAPSVFMMRKRSSSPFDHFEKRTKSESIPYPYTKKKS